MADCARELSTLAEGSRKNAATLELTSLLGLVLDQLGTVVDHTAATIVALQGETACVLAYRGPMPQQCALGFEFRLQDSQILHEVIQRGEPVIVQDVRAETVLARAYQALASTYPGTDRNQVRGWMGIPVISEDQVIGILSLDHHRPLAYSTETIELTQDCAAWAAIVLEHARLFIEVWQRVEQQAVLTELGQALTARLDVDQVLDEAYRGASRLLDTSSFYIALYDLESDQVTFAIDVTEGKLSKPYSSRRAGKGLTEYVIRRREPLLLKKDPLAHLQELGIEAIGPESLSWLGVPLLVGDRVLGVMAVQSYSEAGAYGEPDRDLMASIANPVAIALDNARLFDELQQRVHELEALYKADAKLYRRLDLDQVLQTLVDIALDILQADKGSLMVWDEQRERLEVRVATGFAPETMAQMSFAPGEGSAGQVAVTGKPAIVEDTRTNPSVVTRITEQEGIRSFMHVPIEIGGEIFGVFNVDYAHPRTFGDHEMRLFMALAQRAALAIETTQLHAQAQELAVVEERDRIARDLHDAVTQTLFSASLIAEVLPRIWEQDQSQGSERLEELRELTRGALAEMRTLLLELRPSSLAETDLGELLRQLVDSFAGRARVSVTLEIGQEQPVPPEVKVALYRIAQEALNNVAKHAQAKRAKVSLRCESQELELEICDDGRGFFVNGVPADRLGLRIMQERAESVGAKVDIESRIDCGTRVRIIWHDGRQ